MYVSRLTFKSLPVFFLDFPCGKVVKKKKPACNAGDMGSIPGLGSSPWRGYSNPPQYSCLENPKDRGAWQATVHRITQSQTWVNHIPFNSPTVDQYLGNNSSSIFYWCKEILRLWNKQKRWLCVSTGKLGIIYGTTLQNSLILMKFVLFLVFELFHSPINCG